MAVVAGFPFFQLFGHIIGYVVGLVNSFIWESTLDF
jgi:hypothetical protein